MVIFSSMATSMLIELKYEGYEPEYDELEEADPDDAAYGYAQYEGYGAEEA